MKYAYLAVPNKNRRGLRMFAQGLEAQGIALHAEPSTAEYLNQGGFCSAEAIPVYAACESMSGRDREPWPYSVVCVIVPCLKAGAFMRELIDVDMQRLITLAVKERTVVITNSREYVPMVRWLARVDAIHDGVMSPVHALWTLAQMEIANYNAQIGWFVGYNVRTALKNQADALALPYTFRRVLEELHELVRLLADVEGERKGEITPRMQRALKSLQHHQQGTVRKRA